MKKRLVLFVSAAFILLSLGGCSLRETVNSLFYQVFGGHTLPEPDGFVPMGTMPKEYLEILNGLPYYGDMGVCKMGPKMALAYSDTLSGLPKTQKESGSNRAFGLKASVLDIAGDGFPILMASYPGSEDGGNYSSDTPPRIYSYDNEVVSPVGFGQWGEQWTLELCLAGDKHGLCVRMPHGEEPGLPVGYQFYNIDRGRITRSYTVSEYIAVIMKDGKMAFSMEMPSVPTVSDASGVKLADLEITGLSQAEAQKTVNGYIASTQSLERSGWQRSGSNYYYYRVNGEDWDPNSLAYHTESPLNDILKSVGLQLPEGTGDRCIYSKGNGLAWWLPYKNADETADILYRFATGEENE